MPNANALAVSLFPKADLMSKRLYTKPPEKNATGTPTVIPKLEED
jgi:hypothetical protein